MSNEMLREDLLTSFETLEMQFASSLEQAKELDKAFAAHYSQFHSNLAGLLADAQEKLPETSPLSQSLAGFINGLKEIDSGWKAKLENQNKGLSFRKNFEDSLLVYVYGKVKSGKSSLGNYMAWGHTNPTPAQQAGNTTLKYDSHVNTDAENGDAHNEAALQGKFRVDATEATSSIQSFRLPGLTWVDSPGLHSVRSQNGELAKAHADHADLILYTMKSDAPGRASDLNEIRQLLGKEKEIMLLLTGSDKKQHGWDEVNEVPVDICVMKPAQDRQMQQDFVKRELEAEGVDTGRVQVLSLSARYAELHGNDPAAIADSGMGQLFTRLKQISQEEGVRMKRAVPMTNFKNFLSGCLVEVEKYQALTASLATMIATVDQDVKKQITPAVRLAQSELRQTIQASFNELAASRDDEAGLNSALLAAQKRWDSRMAALTGDALEAILNKAMKAFKSAVVTTWTSSSLTLPAFSVEKVTEQIPEGYTKSTRSRNGGLGALIGGGIGMLLGPAGAAIGATLGAGLGSMTGDSAQQTTRTIEMVVGDNLSEVRNRILSLYLDGIENEITTQVGTLLSTLLNEMEEDCSRLNYEVEQFKRAIGVLKQQAEQQLTSEGNA